MRNLLLIALIIITASSCKQQKEPTTENINSIFQSKDFSIEFRFEEDQTYRLSFREDYMSFFSDNPTQRKDLSYAEAEMVNAFIQEQFNQRSTAITAQEIAVYSELNEVVFYTSDMEEDLYTLFDRLNLSYVSN